MEINRPGAKALTEEQQQLFAQARETLHQKALSGGLTATDVRAIVGSMRAHPDVSYEVIQLLFEEVRQLPEGQRLLSFDD